MATKKQHDTFNKRIEKLLFSLGAISGGKLGYKYTIETNAGLLYINLHEAEKGDIYSVYCIFDNPSKAKEVLDMSIPHKLNAYSGKWNFHEFDAYDLFNEFKNNLTTIMKKDDTQWFNSECEIALAEVPQGIKDIAKKNREMTLQIAETIALKKCFRKEAVLTYLDTHTFLCKGDLPINTHFPQDELKI